MVCKADSGIRESVLKCIQKKNHPTVRQTAEVISAVSGNAPDSLNPQLLLQQHFIDGFYQCIFRQGSLCHLRHSAHRNKEQGRNTADTK